VREREREEETVYDFFVENFGVEQTLNTGLLV
jgi:hypothetical protein